MQDICSQVSKVKNPGKGLKPRTKPGTSHYEEAEGSVMEDSRVRATKPKGQCWTRESASKANA